MTHTKRVIASWQGALCAVARALTAQSNASCCGPRTWHGPPHTLNLGILTHDIRIRYSYSLRTSCLMQMLPALEFRLNEYTSRLTRHHMPHSPHVCCVATAIAAITALVAAAATAAATAAALASPERVCVPRDGVNLPPPSASRSDG